MVQGEDLVDGVPDGEGLDVVATIVLDEVFHAFFIVHSYSVQGCCCFRFEYWVALSVYSDATLEKFDEYKSRVALQSTLTKAEIFHHGWRSPAASVQAVGFSDSLGGEVIEVMLHQILDIVAEEDLELLVEGVGDDGPGSAGGSWNEHVGSWLSDDPGARVVPGNHTHGQGEETISVENVDSFSRRYTHVCVSFIRHSIIAPLPGINKHHVATAGLSRHPPWHAGPELQRTAGHEVDDLHKDYKDEVSERHDTVRRSGEGGGRGTTGILPFNPKK